MTFAEKIVDRAVRTTSSVWITEPDLLHLMSRTNTGTLNDIVYGVKEGNLKKYMMSNGIAAYTTHRLNQMENDVAVHVMRLQFANPSKHYPDSIIDRLIDDFEETKNEGRKLHCHQRDAVRMVCNNNFSVLTGGPGTGKTTVLTAINYVLHQLNPKTSIVFTAPTGKAARHITEATGEHSSTIHKKMGLGYNLEKAEIFYEDILFVDESSMNDIELTATLLKAIPDGRKVVFVGDKDQLPSVGPGAVLRDLIASAVIPVTMLTHTFRQDQKSMLFTNICNIREGRPVFNDGDDFHSICLPDGDQNENAISLIKKLYIQEVAKYGAEEVVVLLPYRKAGICSNLMNNLLQPLINKQPNGYRHRNEADRYTLFFTKGDYVMQLENREECANGEVGTVIAVSAAGVDVKFTDGTVHYSPSDLDQLALSYSMTIHKSQGSEYKSVILCMLDNHNAMLQRNLLYTGITRAKKECTVIYQQNALVTACKTLADANRLTMLKEKLQDIRAQYQTVYGI